MEQREHVWPLAPATDRLSSDVDAARALSVKKVRRRKYVKCCGCITALLLILALVTVILLSTVFGMKEPELKLNSFTVTQLKLISGRIPEPGFNMSFIADISVKNPNVASYRYSNTTTSLYYHGMFVGEARGPPGYAKAQETLRMNLTVDIITDRLLSSPNLQSDYVSGLLPVVSYTRVGGKANILNVFKMHVTVTMNCSVALNISSQGIQEHKCSKRKVDL
ncbi:uncharacterized protein LOC123222357 [Mangifera indica]|uniref:uncharacterized protein LOC123222357 n=1 Tax=Mangifera indica TaxID=29780 RepID=UPI001CFB0A93|nr:uncharacterized protein LOC123222357 [Mangifera indica]